MIAIAAPYAGLFVTAFVAATLLPAQSEILLSAMAISGRYDLLLLLLSATAGNTLGSLFNWLLGRGFERLRDRRWFPLKAATVEKAVCWYARWGKWSLLLSWAPIVGDPLTFAAGLLRTPLRVFLPLVLLAKGGRYAVLLIAVEAVR